jgi:hypothetical protein
MSTPSEEVLSLLAYRLHAVSIAHFALRHALAWDQTPSIKILFDGQQIVEGKATAFTNGAIEAGIVHSRALLEFLGLSGKSQTELREVTARSRTDDIAIEQFAGLSKLSIQKAIQSYPGPSEEAESALAYVVYLANKGLAHTTSSFTKHDQGAVLLEVAFRGVPALVCNNFYIPLKIDPPRYELQGQKRAG